VKLCIIPARGGSKRVPRKNVRDFRGMPMIAYPIELAKKLGLFDLILVTTDDAEIAKVAFSHGASVMHRPPDDGAVGTQETASRLLDQLQMVGGAACVIYPCTPLLDLPNLRLGWEWLLKAQTRSYVRAVGIDGKDAGCFYWGWVRAYRDRVPLDAFHTTDLVLPPERTCDVDTPEDWSRAETMYDALKGKK
jgi:pseudaminic acid cytidylyltransferase